MHSRDYADTEDVYVGGRPQPSLSVTNIQTQTLNFIINTEDYNRALQM